MPPVPGWSSGCCRTCACRPCDTCKEGLIGLGPRNRLATLESTQAKERALPRTLATRCASLSPFPPIQSPEHRTRTQNRETQTWAARVTPPCLIPALPTPPPPLSPNLVEAGLCVGWVVVALGTVLSMAVYNYVAGHGVVRVARGVGGSFSHRAGRKHLTEKPAQRCAGGTLGDALDWRWGWRARSTGQGAEAASPASPMHRLPPTSPGRAALRTATCCSHPPGWRSSTGSTPGRARHKARARSSTYTGRRMRQGGQARARARP